MAAKIITREEFDLSCGGGFCPCHRLAQEDFCRIIESGMSTVKAVYKEQGVKAKCGDCVLRVKTLLEQHTTHFSKEKQYESDTENQARPHDGKW